MISVLFSGDPDKRSQYGDAVSKAAKAAGLQLRLSLDPAEVAPEVVEYLIYDGSGPVQDFTPFTRLRGVMNLWAGVEAVLRCPAPPDLQIARMIEPGLTEGMRDYVIGHVMRHHLDVDRYIGTEPITEWEVTFPPLARNRTVGILGIGTLGADCAAHLAGLGFNVLGWSRSAKEIAGVTCLSGDQGLEDLIAAAEILVLLLPHTAETERVLNADRLAALPEGACIVNAGRGPLIDHDALLAALDRGHIRHATMDVFDVEPLPPEHPYWSHPKVTVTPHIASVTRPETASEAIVANIRRDQAGQPMLGIVQRTRGY
ncbi:MAG: glyoxylate/hydroxypyruvate reductase A [Pseudomonadota bacterium]